MNIFTNPPNSCTKGWHLFIVVNLHLLKGVDYDTFYNEKKESFLCAYGMARLPPTDITSYKSSKDVVICVHLIGKFLLLYCCIAVSQSFKSVNIVPVLTWVRQADYILPLWIFSLSLCNNELACIRYANSNSFPSLERKAQILRWLLFIISVKVHCYFTIPSDKGLYFCANLVHYSSTQNVFPLPYMHFPFLFFLLFFLSSESNHILAARSKNS